MMDAPDLGEASEDDLTIPRAAMNKMIKEIVPHLRVANDARELILKCCTEFIHHVTTQANEICNEQQKKTITAEHLIKAFETLGFPEYKADAEQVLQEYRQGAAKRRRQSTRLENLGIPEDKLLKLQQELFAKAREEQAELEHQEWLQLQQAAQKHQMLQAQRKQDDGDDDDY